MKGKTLDIIIDVCGIIIDINMDATHIFLSLGLLGVYRHALALVCELEIDDLI